MIGQHYKQVFHRLLACALLCTCGGVLVSCAMPAYQQLDLQAAESGLIRSTVNGDKFRHVLYASGASDTGPDKDTRRDTGNDTLHVYIEGDGVNWQWNRLVRADPTPQRSLMLGLMKNDRENLLYLGRPCYLGLELDDGCDADHWTYERYSQQVVDSMVAVIEAEARQYRSIVLIGHSGGGALALLMAEQLPAVTAIVTIAAIVDTDAWTTHHGYTRLVGSLNPATRKPLPANIRQLHLTGGRDQNMPSAIARQWVASQPGAKLWEIPDNSHLCCWNRNWPAVLQWLASVSGNTVTRNSPAKAPSDN